MAHMSFAMPQELKSRLLRSPRLVKQKVFLQRPKPRELATIREALDRGLKPAGFSVEGDTIILVFALNGLAEPFA
jgi:hypothetical protein